MIKVINECCDCATPSYPCRGSSCPNLHVKRYYCDKCGEEIDDVPYEYFGMELCRKCYRKEVDADDYC